MLVQRLFHLLSIENERKRKKNEKTSCRATPLVVVLYKGEKLAGLVGLV
jgi:hypothetical protein